jgi:hypothetical protein
MSFKTLETIFGSACPLQSSPAAPCPSPTSQLPGDILPFSLEMDTHIHGSYQPYQKRPTSSLVGFSDPYFPKKIVHLLFIFKYTVTSYK